VHYQAACLQKQQERERKKEREARKREQQEAERQERAVAAQPQRWAGVASWAAGSRTSCIEKGAKSIILLRDLLPSVLVCRNRSTGAEAGGPATTSAAAASAPAAQPTASAAMPVLAHAPSAQAAFPLPPSPAHPALSIVPALTARPLAQPPPQLRAYATPAHAAGLVAAPRAAPTAVRHMLVPVTLLQPVQRAAGQPQAGPSMPQPPTYHPQPAGSSAPAPRPVAGMAGLLGSMGVCSCTNIGTLPYAAQLLLCVS
jgi:hypothetical protein